LWYGMRKGDAMFEVNATFRDEGECRLKVNAKSAPSGRCNGWLLKSCCFEVFPLGLKGLLNTLETS
jgi:hypothetical protein